MMTVFTFVLILVVAAVTVVTAFFVLEVLAGLFPSRLAQHACETPRSVIVIPAQDEQAVIGQTLDRLTGDGAYPSIVVVADNCVDQTAALARAAGAHVIVREDEEHRGKGFALAAARDFLRNEPPDVVIILDADCHIDRSSLDALSKAAASSGRAAQGVYLLTPDLRAAPLVQISNFAFMIKNLVRQRGLQKLAGRAHLTGTGMALPWDVFNRAELGGSNIVEDLALGLDLSAQYAPPLFVERANVWSPSASAGGTLVQRRRWEGGYLATALKQAPPMFIRSLIRCDVCGLLGALDLAIPPLSLLVVFNGVALMVATALTVLQGKVWPLVAQILVAILAVAALSLAWVREGRRFASATTLLRLPIYVMWKLPIYLELVRRGAPKEWLRTGR